MKLVRNTLGDKKFFKADNGHAKWKDLTKLYAYQKEQKFRAANKSTKQHIEFDNNLMN